MRQQKIGLLVMAYGTPYKVEDIERYYTHIRHGRKPSAEALRDLVDKYQAIGGVSPLARITEEQAYAIGNVLNDIRDDYEFDVYIGLRHIEPFIEDAVQQMAAEGITQAVSIVLAPHFSRFSIDTYNRRAADEAAKHGINIVSVESWYNEAGYIKYWADESTSVYEQRPEEERKEAILIDSAQRLLKKDVKNEDHYNEKLKETAQLYDEMPEREREASRLIVSAHRLQRKIVKDDDPYIDTLKETAQLLAEQPGLTSYTIGWQSEGNTPDPWIGPDVLDLTRDLHRKKG